MKPVFIYLRYLCVAFLYLGFPSDAASGKPMEFKEKMVISKTETDKMVNDPTDAELVKLFSQRLLNARKAMRYDGYPSGLSCASCIIILDVLRKIWTQRGVSHSVAVQATIRMCTALGIQHHEVCSGVVRRNEKELFYVFKHGSLRSDELCSAVIDKDCGGETALEKPWSVALPPAPKPPVAPVKPFKAGVLKVLHLTDPHIDLQYKQNTSSQCGEPLCCREKNGPGDAGYWGSYGCDLPMRTFESALQHVKQNHKDLSYIIVTGDIPPHDIWEDSRKSQLEIMRKALEKIAEYFPDKQVFVASGNHDTQPVNSFPPPSLGPEFSVQWLYDSYADMWSQWLPNISLFTVRKGGFYTALVSEGFRIVSLNTNYCNRMNWWLMINNTDPAQELQWLVRVLQNAEEKGEKVHIINHIPTGDETCFKNWGRNYRKIINRYESTVTAQFAGHTHCDHFQIFYDTKDKRPTSLWYIAPCLTVSHNFQPGYRIYEIDGDHENSSRVVLDHKTYVLNLAKSNKNKKAFWELEYSAKDAYNMNSLLPKDWDDLVTRLEQDDTLFQKFYQFKYRFATKRHCDRDCKRRELCGLRSAVSHDQRFCRVHDGGHDDDDRDEDVSI